MVPGRSRVARLFGISPLGPESRPWYLGALGEREVARLLDQLGADWHAIHSVPVGTSGSDIDHVLVGPGGVYTVNSKFHDGARVWVAGRSLLVNGQRKDHLRNAAFEARRASKLITRAAGSPVHVSAIIAIVGARSLTIRAQPAEVAVLSSVRMVRWLKQRPAVLNEEEVRHIAGTVMRSSTWGSQSAPDADLSAFATLRDAVVAAKRRRVLWAVGVVLSPFVVMTVTFIGSVLVPMGAHLN
ncbi:nuclease-related domain-containing protein [Microbacterium horticulturae]|uniref:Nuclease-related domain-containing protein n=1 Tax=Microbacterium horticulturae TaxID=3028316 RepID=A0ABY8BXB1_9MICO|nr:nuclease-related domain-containing protein [Microbacterium sp. KACC 23027]WEG08804.1 nuclease-related domain-containing protein [Microbacterium sp. KACC 23027]